jgi:hypothetical protein
MILKNPTPSEQDIKRDVKAMLSRVYWNRASIFANNSGDTGPPRYVKFGLNNAIHQRGSSDLIGIVHSHCPNCGHGPLGRFVAMELKKFGENPDDNQIAFLDRINALGGYGVVVRNLFDVDRHMTLAISGAKNETVYK